jgi:hypothetical protein
MEPRSFKMQIMNPKTWSAPTITGLPYNFCFIKFLPSCTVDAEYAPYTLFRAPLTPGLGPWLGLGGLYLTKFTTGKVHYNFGLINFARKWLAVAPEEQEAQVLQIRIMGLKHIPSPLKQDCPTTFVLWSFLLVALLRL